MNMGLVGARSILLGLLGLTLALPLGCQEEERDGYDEEITPEAVAAYEGIYEMSAWTDEATGCSGGGEDQLAAATDRYFVIVGFELFGLQLLEAVTCADVTACQATAEAVRNGQPYGSTFSLTLSEMRAEDELWGLTAETGVERDGTCVERVYQDHLLTGTAEALTLTSTRKDLPDRPAEDGFCVVVGNEAVREAEDVPCSGQRVVKGTRIMGL